MNEQTLQLMNEQAELLKEMGEYLRRLRQQQEISLEEVASVTMIPVRTLTAIEEGDMKRLPEPVYVQGFIRRYADAIGQDGNEFANAFPTDTHHRSYKPRWRGRIEAQLRPIHLYLVYTLLVVGSVSSLSYVLQRSSGANLRYATTPQSVTPNELQPSGEFYGPPVPSADPGATPRQPQRTQTAKAAPTDKPVRVSLTVIGQQSWLRILVDGKPEFEGMLSQGTQRTWMGNDQVTVRAGDAGAIQVSYNDSQPQPLGKPGDVQEKTFGRGTASTIDSLGFSGGQGLALGTPAAALPR